MEKAGIVSLLSSPHIWRVGDLTRVERTGHPTGCEALDAALPEGGWPQQGITELLTDQMGAGEVSLLLPVLAALTQQSRNIAWINPPCLPYAPALTNGGVALPQLLVVHATTSGDSLWAAELAMRSGALGAVLFWLKQSVDYAALRRLHLAAEAGNCSAFIYRGTTFATHPSPAPLRIKLEIDAGNLALTLIKRRGLMTSRRIDLNAKREKPVALSLTKARPALALVAH